ncbi:MAG TPA: YqhV family protein [Firmicutes bacterium]|nr:YqhV family protein [Bacillota bacterium]
MTGEAEVVRSMALLRFIAGSLEITAALLMLHYGKVGIALRINAGLGLFGPIILTSVSLLGLAGLAGRIPLNKLAIVAAGVLLILWGTKQ